MVTRQGLEAWLKGAIVLTCYANSTSQTQIIPSLISRLAQVSGPTNDSTWLRDCRVHGDASGRTCYKARQTGCTNPAYQILRQDLLGAQLVHTLYAASWCFPPRSRTDTRQLLRAWTDNCHEKLNWERAW